LTLSEFGHPRFQNQCRGHFVLLQPGQRGPFSENSGFLDRFERANDDESDHDAHQRDCECGNFFSTFFQTLSWPTYIYHRTNTLIGGIELKVSIARLATILAGLRATE
jgi:hypothetical protein